MFTQKDFEFLQEMGKLKSVIRFEGKYWDDYAMPRWESVADHVWRMAFMLVFYKERITVSFDFEKTIKMILIHDLPEIRTWDIPLMSDLRKDANFAAQKSEHEKQVFSEMFSGYSGEFFEIFQEFEAKETIEAKLVNNLDRIEWAFQAFEYFQTIGEINPEHLQTALERWEKGTIRGVDPFLESILDDIKDRAVREFQTQ